MPILFPTIEANSYFGFANGIVAVYDSNGNMSFYHGRKLIECSWEEYVKGYKTFFNLHFESDDSPKNILAKHGCFTEKGIFDSAVHIQISRDKRKCVNGIHYYVVKNQDDRIVAYYSTGGRNKRFSTDKSNPFKDFEIPKKKEEVPEKEEVPFKLETSSFPLIEPIDKRDDAPMKGWITAVPTPETTPVESRTPIPTTSEIAYIGFLLHNNANLLEWIHKQEEQIRKQEEQIREQEEEIREQGEEIDTIKHMLVELMKEVTDKGWKFKIPSVLAKILPSE